MKNKIIYVALLLFIVISCKKENKTTVSEIQMDSNFVKYNPEVIKNFSHKNFEKTDAFLIQDLQLIIAEPKEGQKYFARHLVALIKENKIVLEAQGTDDLFIYEPHFFISKDKKQVIICVRMAYEYGLGMDVFLIENNTIKNIGTIDVDTASDGGPSIVDVTKIIKNKDQIEFSFKADSLDLGPGWADLIVPNKVKYIYKNNKLEFVSSDPKIKFPKAETLKSATNIQSDAENQFNIYISKKMKKEEQFIDTQETYLGDLTGDGLEDVIIFYTTAANGSNTVTDYKTSLFVNENGKMKQYPGFEGGTFTVKGISNNKINIIRYNYADDDELGKPSIEISRTLSLTDDKKFVE